MLYCLSASRNIKESSTDELDFENKHFHASKNAVRLCNLAVKFVDLLRYDMSKALKKSKRFDPPAKIEHLANKASTIVSIGND